MSPVSRAFYSSHMNWHEVFSAAYQIPLCFSAALLIALIGKMLLSEFTRWMGN
jgi:hypothetical protein